MEAIPNVQPQRVENIRQMLPNNCAIAFGNEAAAPVIEPVREDQEQLPEAIPNVQPRRDENPRDMLANNHATPFGNENAAPLVENQIDLDFQLAIDMQLAYNIADAPETPEKREQPKRNKRTVFKLNYDVSTCCVCNKHYQTNDFPTLEDDESVCSTECYRRMQNEL